MYNLFKESVVCLGTWPWGVSEFSRRRRRAHGEDSWSQSADMATEEKLVPGPPFFFSELPHLYTLSSSILSYNFDFLVIPVTLGIITLYMWSTFGKVDLGKRLIQALILGLTSFRQGIPGCQLPETWFRRWEPYSITVSLSLGLPTHSS